MALADSLPPWSDWRPRTLPSEPYLPRTLPLSPLCFACFRFRDVGVCAISGLEKLKTKANGDLICERIIEYNSRWLPKTKTGWEKEPHEYDALDPVEIWQEDAWTFVRRMVGDYLSQKLFYEFLTITWILIGVDKGNELQKISRCPD